MLSRGLRRDAIILCGLWISAISALNQRYDQARTVGQCHKMFTRANVLRTRLMSMGIIRKDLTQSSLSYRDR